MKKPVETNKLLKIGSASFNSLALKGLTKEEFKKMYAGKLTTDLNEAWKVLRKYTK